MLRAVKRQKETQLAQGQQQEITNIRPETRVLMSRPRACAKRSREKALQLGGKEKNAVFMSLAQRKFSSVNRKRGIS